ncbi:ATP-dependent DNA helicase RecG [Erysipelatoclostridium sp. AM42-17]|uniref:ATP-dependent DNA helicase RecG n=1 Tax=Erysipelatoclostridium sp. AM42-17 TaxID=2293102 RepID=UPI001F4838D8|nr:ATP-dependent DNA helicase RecG [Erysipelatoclostridium sp. AM42-17]
MEHSLKELKIKDNRITLLENMGIHNIKDLVLYFPYRYEVIEPTELINQEKVIIEATLIDQPKVFFKGRLSRLTFTVLYKDLPLKVAIFNRHFLKAHMHEGMTLTLIGKYTQKNHSLVASEMKLQPLDQLEGITPVYTVKGKMTQKSLRGYINKALHFYQNHILDILPDYLIQQYHLISRQEAYFKIHQPHQNSDVIQAIRYLKYEEFFKFQLTMNYIKQYHHEHVGMIKEIDDKKLQQFINQLPFSLTKDQSTAVEEIITDLKSDKLMYRFVQGDVGSGKTVVGAIGLYANYLAGYQGAMMAPTEILALQHYQSLTHLFKNTDVKIGLLTGHLSQKEKNELYLQIAQGDIDLIVGTHALFQEKVQYQNLGLVITDEQHRFGVEQRKALKDKGQKVDFLVMSATPIPRTLAMSLYGDMDVSTIQSMPRGRKKVITEYVPSISMKPFLPHLKQYLASGGQCYVVCPLVNESESLNCRDANQIYDAMSRYFKGQYKVGLVHGKLSDEQKNEMMKQFSDNQIQILVSTTVIEVGVDVSNANMIVIYNADRFGLSQLHQLRGRVGRGSQQGYCYLLSDSKIKEAKERLMFLANHNDGFEISKYDLQIRGPGDLLGQKQSGVPTFMIGDVMKDFNILEIARKDAIDALNNHASDEKIKQLLLEIKNNLLKNNEYVD